MNHKRMAIVTIAAGLLLAIIAVEAARRPATALGRPAPYTQHGASGSSALSLLAADTVSTTFTYQGLLKGGGVPANGLYDFEYLLFDDPAGGRQVGTVVAAQNVSVADGLFTVELDFGDVFDGRALWLEIRVRPAGDTGGFTLLSPRQPLAAAPYALALRPGATITGATSQPLTAALNLGNSSGDGLRVVDASVGLRVLSASSSALIVESTGSDGLRVSDAADDGIDIDAAGDKGVEISSTGAHGLTVSGAGGDGVRVFSAESYGVYVDAAGADGVYVDAAEFDGVRVNEAGSEGFRVNSAGSDGVHVVAAQGHGVYVGEAGSHSVYAASTSATNYAGYFVNTATGGEALYAEGGSTLTPDLVLGGSTRGFLTSDGSDPSSNLRFVSYDDVLIWLDDDNGEAGVFGIYNGANALIFVVDESGNMSASGTKSTVVEAGEAGRVRLYALESPENWFEDFGSASLSAGEATVVIEPGFASTVNLERDYRVFLTPLGDCALYVAEKSPAAFTVRAMDGATCSVDFDYRLVARRLGYEDLRLEPADLNPLAEEE